MTSYAMDDQTSTISAIIDAKKAGNLDRAKRLVRQLDATAEARGCGKDYWLRFCQSMVEIHKH